MDGQTTWLIVRYFGDIPRFGIVNVSRILHAPAVFTRGQRVDVISREEDDPVAAFVVVTSSKFCLQKKNYPCSSVAYNLLLYLILALSFQMIRVT